MPGSIEALRLKCQSRSFTPDAFVEVGGLVSWLGENRTMQNFLNVASNHVDGLSFESA